MVCNDLEHTFWCANYSTTGGEDNVSQELSHSEIYMPRTPDWVFTFLGVCVAFMGLIGILGNATVICLFLRYRKLQTVSNTYVVSLACTDLLMCLVNFPMFATANITSTWPLYPVSCQVTGFVGSLTGYISINTLAAMAAERCCVIRRTKLLPMYGSKTSNIIVIVFIWIYSIIWAALPLAGWGRYVMYGKRACSFDFSSRDSNNVSFIISIYILCFSLQLFIIIGCYTSIFVTVYSHDKELCKMQLIISNGTQRKTVSRRKLEYKVARLLLFIIFLFCVSWMPYAVLALINIFGDTRLVTPLGVAIAGVLAKTSTVINPMIYAISHPRFKNCMLMCVQLHDKNKRSLVQSNLYPASFQQTSFRKTTSKDTPPSQV